ncbi:hypothetical protein IWX49DRAFT_234163 [Phyllosticta citricarpa]|uniref:Uncharacterized protein n=2 Tax=Phyllosticta TaxID=121621 RepID=A0ABR1LX03_9PEZI
MAFRERVKRALGRKSSSNSSSASSVKKTSSGRRDSSVWYQPGEKLPPLKYRRPVTKEHKELLESFSFQKAWRRKSDMSQYSPMGSRFPSRRNSRKGTTAAAPARRTQQHVIEDLPNDRDVANVGLSPQRSCNDADTHRHLALTALTTNDGAAGPKSPSTYNTRPPSSGSTRTTDSTTNNDDNNAFSHHAFAQDLLHALNHSRVAVA